MRHQRKPGGLQGDNNPTAMRANHRKSQEAKQKSQRARLGLVQDLSSSQWACLIGWCREVAAKERVIGWDEVEWLARYDQEFPTNWKRFVGVGWVSGATMREAMKGAGL